MPGYLLKKRKNYFLEFKKIPNLKANAQIVKVGLTLPEVGKTDEEQQYIFFKPLNFKFLSTIFG